MTITITAQQTQDLHVQDAFEVFLELAITVVTEDDWVGSLETAITLDGEGLQYISYEVVGTPIGGMSDNLTSLGGTLILTASEGWAGYETLPNLIVKFTVVAIRSGTYTVAVTGTSKSIWGVDRETESESLSVTVKRGIQPEVTVHIPGILQTTCPICALAILTDSQTWAGHMEYVHSATNSWGFPPQVSGGEYRCYGCGRQFYTRAAVLTHLYESHRAVV